MRVYFDNSATTKPLKEVREEVYYAMDEFWGNPSSLHKLGVKSQRKIEEIQESIARRLNCSKEEIIFTSGGSEGNNMVIKGLVGENNHIITTAFEHSSVLNTYRELEKQGVSVTYLKVDNKGFIDLKELEEAINKNTVLISVMHVNNEIGSIQRIKEIGKLIKEKSKRAKFHVDGVQGFGKFKIDVKECNIDFYSVSAHKFHGPKGVGFMYMRKGLNLKSLITGGGQQGGLRAGTENIPGYMGMVKAINIAYDSLEDSYSHVKMLKEYFIEKLSKIENVIINAPNSEEYSPYILNVSFLGTRSEVLLHMLEEDNIFVSTGSACSSKSAVAKGSYVLNAMGLEPRCIQGAIRFSFSKYNTLEEVDYTINSLEKSLKFLRRIKI
ncbi:aminotransferase class V-fold PLP-dependent enzyme [Clostridium perfringens]|nr:aminotransferase class V-fold PLP-dependent enzyme [Clostridium perfringens]